MKYNKTVLKEQVEQIKTFVDNIACHIYFLTMSLSKNSYT